MMRVDALDYGWRRHILAGDQVDAQNVFGNWCPARVLQVVDGEVLLQFFNMHETWRQWLQLDSGRLAQLGTKVRCSKEVTSSIESFLIAVCLLLVGVNGVLCRETKLIGTE